LGKYLVVLWSLLLLLLLGLHLVVWTISGRPCGGLEGLLQGVLGAFSGGMDQNGQDQHPLFVKTPSIQNQAQHIVDGMIDRMYFLVEQGRTDCAASLHKEIEEWLILSKHKIEVLSIEEID
jgi:hypothetical protein